MTERLDARKADLLEEVKGKACCSLATRHCVLLPSQSKQTEKLSAGLSSDGVGMNM